MRTHSSMRTHTYATGVRCQHLDDVREDGVINEAVNQIAFSDRILLNKVDLVTPQQKAAVYDSIRSINALAHVIETKQCR